ncbi:MAG: SRPBCC domain-containing protein [Bacteroidota bacterium]|nr:SRPBCC domain-containing protein [Bacteroidota bacterium]
MINKETVFSKDTENKKLTVVRAFAAPLPLVWTAWTDPAILDQWWAPLPWHAETKTMDFKEGGLHLYNMKGPAGEISWSIERYKTIRPQTLIVNDSAFCDQDGRENPDMPSMHWRKQFSQTGDATTVNVELTFDTEEDMEGLIKMGFREGFSMGLDNLERYLSTQK